MRHFNLSHFRAAAMLAGLGGLAIVPKVIRRAPETKDNTDPALLSREVKEAMEAFQKNWKSFQEKNDEHLKELKKGFDDVLRKEELERINKAIDEAQALVKRRCDDLEAKANAFMLSAGGGEAAVAAKNAAIFAELLEPAAAKDFSPEQLKKYTYELSRYLRRDEKATQLMVGADPSGGYWVTPDVNGRIVKKVYETTPMRQLANVVAIGTDTLEGPIDNGEVDAQWVGEVATRAQTDVAQTGKWVISVHELYAYPWVTQKLLDDAKIDVEGWLGNKSADKFARKENSAFVSGDGELKPKGLLAYPTAATADASRPWGTFEHVSAGVATISAFLALNAGASDKIIDVIYSLKAAYRQNAKFLMSRNTVSTMRKMKDGQGNYVWAPGATAGQPSVLFNYPVAEGEDMPAMATTTVPLAFGDFGETYTIVDRLGISVVRDNITKPGFVKYHMRKRVGGGAVNFESMKFLKMT